MYRKSKVLSAEEALDLYFALPSEPEDSDVDADEGVESQSLEEAHTSDPQPSTSRHASDVSMNYDVISSDEEVEMEEDWSEDSSKFDSLDVDMGGEGEVNSILTMTMKKEPIVYLPLLVQAKGVGPSSESESDSDNETCDGTTNGGWHNKDFKPKQEQYLGHSGLNVNIRDAAEMGNVVSAVIGDDLIIYKK
ncbi:hypothetical protein C0J52_23532 [Blattella germanica]|nr:hypothetical protein C0J52_23532 [Blattella germanica]